MEVIDGALISRKLAAGAGLSISFRRHLIIAARRAM
jgi:hypothetical protein